MPNVQTRYRLDKEMRELVNREGIAEVLASAFRVGREAGRGSNHIFNKLNTAYENLVPSVPPN